MSESVIKRPVIVENGMLLDDRGWLMSSEMCREELADAAACINHAPRAIELLRLMHERPEYFPDIAVRALLTAYDTALKGDNRGE